MLTTLIRRNMKLFFRDKGLFFTSLITPMILLVLYATFLGNVYRDSFETVFAPFGGLEEKLLSGCVGAQLISSLLAVSCVTVSFCSNFLSVQDKVTGAAKDFSITPVKNSTLALSYYLASFFSTLLVCLTASGICFAYLAMEGWYMSLAEVLYFLLDVVVMVLFGTALSSVINVFLSSQGQISAVGSIVSSVYGFLCGAYMPISQFSKPLQKILSFMPGTYGTSLFRNHAMGGVFREMEKLEKPLELIEEMKEMMDCNVVVLKHDMTIPQMYAAVLGITLALLLLLILLQKKKAK